MEETNHGITEYRGIENMDMTADTAEKVRVTDRLCKVTDRLLLSNSQSQSRTALAVELAVVVVLNFESPGSSSRRDHLAFDAHPRCESTDKCSAAGEGHGQPQRSAQAIHVARDDIIQHIGWKGFAQARGTSSYDLKRVDHGHVSAQTLDQHIGEDRFSCRNEDRCSAKLEDC